MQDATSLYSGGTQQQQRGTELTQVYEGDKVEVLRIFPPDNHSRGSGGAVEIRLEGLTGVFPSQCLKIMNQRAQ